MAVEPEIEAGRRPGYPWYYKAGAILWAFFCFEIGVLLILLPWIDFWNHNSFSSLLARWPDLWMSPYFRGAVSGLGVADIAIAFTELMRLRRFSRPRPSARMED